MATDTDHVYHRLPATHENRLEMIITVYRASLLAYRPK